jgi:predicted DNA-binding protein (UPF0251 family)
VSPTQYKAAIKTLGLSQERAGEWLGVSPRTSQNYAAKGPPEPVAKLLRLVVEMRAIEKATGDTQHSKFVAYLKIIDALNHC